MSGKVLSYVPYMPWSCDRCGASGDVLVDPTMDCSARYDAAKVAHALRSPECKAPFVRVGEIYQTTPTVL